MLQRGLSTPYMSAVAVRVRVIESLNIHQLTVVLFLENLSYESLVIIFSNADK